MNENWAAYAATCAMVVALTGCGGGGGATSETKPAQEDLLKPYREQVLSWAACDSTILGAAQDLSQSEYAGRLQCAYLRAPIDYDQPSRGDVSVAMMRLSATDPGKKRGSLFMNPGGPGTDGLKLAFRLADLYLKQSDPNTEMGALQLRLLDAYDVIGFSPRGTGASTRLECGTNEVSRPIDLTPEGRTPQVIENMLYNARKQAEACRKNPLTPYINSDATARDMDLMRGLVGDEKLNYLGYSYGTWLGAWYAARFPERAGRMVLDSSTDFSSNDLDGDIQRSQSIGRQRMWDEVYAPYAARHAYRYNLGGTADAVRATYQAIRPDVRGFISGGLTANMYAVHKQIDEALGWVVMGKGLSAAKNAAPDADVDALIKALDDVVFVPGDAELDAQAREDAAELAQEMAKPATSESISLAWAEAVRVSVRCNDSIVITDPNYWVTLGNTYAQKYPLTGSIVTDTACPYWGGPSVTRPPVAALMPLNIMVVQSQFDGATPAEGALKAFESLPNGHMVYVQNEATHGLFPYMQACVDAPVIRHLLGESASTRKIVCEGKPLPLDVVAQTRQRSFKVAAPASGFKDPQVAEDLIDAFKQEIGPRSSKPYPFKAKGK